MLVAIGREGKEQLIVVPHRTAYPVRNGKVSEINAKIIDAVASRIYTANVTVSVDIRKMPEACSSNKPKN